MAEPGYTVIVPAHDEEAGIARTLRGLGADRDRPGRQVIIACNACTDRTAEVARSVAPGAEVIELIEGGKWHALNQAMQLARHGTVIVVDADVEVDAAALDALALALEDKGTWAVSPGVELDPGEGDAWVRAYYRAYERHPYLHSGIGAAGVYGLSAAGRAALGAFPRIISDDGYVRLTLPEARQKRVLDGPAGPVRARVHPPRRWIELVRSEARWRRGDRELSALIGRKPAQAPGFLGSRVRSGEIAPGDALAYLSIKLLGRLALLFEPLSHDRSWRKDASSRG